MAKCYGNSLIGTSGINGDRFYISSDRSTIMLADGVSGAGADGKVAMSTLCVETAESMSFCESGLSPEVYIRENVWKINNELITMSQQKIYMMILQLSCTSINASAYTTID